MFKRAKQCIILLPSIAGIIACTMGYSVMDYYYVNFAMNHGASKLQASFVIAAFKGSMVIGYQLGSCLLRMVDRRKGGTCLLFALSISEAAVSVIYWCSTFTVFYALSFVVYIIRALVCAMLFQFLVAPFMVQFSKRKIAATAIMEMVWGVGCMLSVGVAGFLMDLWAFPLPYICFSVYMLIIIPVYYKSKELVADVKQTITDQETGISHLKLFQCPKFLCCIVSCAMCYTALGFNGATLEPFMIEQFGVSTSFFGVIAMLHPIFYAIGCATIGFFFAQKQFKPLLCVGAVLLSALGFALQGPISILPFEANLICIAIAQVCTGFGSAVQVVSGLGGAFSIAAEKGYADNVMTSSKIVGWTCGLDLIAIMITPLWASFVVEKCGYKTGVDAIFALNIIITVCMCVLLAIDRNDQMVNRSSSTDKVANSNFSLAFSNNVRSPVVQPQHELNKI